ncbi:hypothetical protein HRG_007416 [Hirsutella rhossiliensis]|uniref:Uncharacterized protein n=1 Tax=Hirsutella rhossiliensis TaxID=111463 RepID=A0A9P8SFW1_9HYPO|nr:uncharacterized protein HRG_07416 [Hirsutella rhossiliensis]KAH0961338.1 hypothetical protein HRG_07416 [Hirsutella rhossiliensis]
MAMTIPSSSRIFQQIEDIQIRISQCEQELKSHKSPRFEYEERLTDVNTRIDEAWERLFSGQSPIDRSELQSKILNYGRELERIESEHKEGLELQRLLTSVVSMLFGKTLAKGLSQYWNLCCFQIHRKKQKTGSSSKHFRMGQLEISRKALNRQHPSNQLGVVGLLGGLARRPLTPAAKATGLDRMIQPQWKRRRITESQERHSDDSLNENDGQDLRSFDLMDANIDKRIKHVGRVRQFVNEREKSRAKDKDDASASQRARSVDAAEINLSQVKSDYARPKRTRRSQSTGNAQLTIRNQDLGAIPIEKQRAAPNLSRIAMATAQGGLRSCTSFEGSHINYGFDLRI